MKATSFTLANGAQAPDFCEQSSSFESTVPEEERENDSFADERTLFLRKAAVVIASGSVLTGASLTIAAKSVPKIQHEQFAHILVRDKPLNEIPILIEHNAGTQPGSGTITGIGNQNLTIEQTLNQTPVRGFELDLWKVNDETVIIHGGVPQPGSQLNTLTDSISAIKTWMDAPKDQGELVYIVIEDHLSAQQSNEAIEQIKSTFGSSVFSVADKEEFFAEHGRWPSVDEMTAGGSRIMIISDRVGSQSDTVFSAKEIKNAFGQINEDRSLIGGLGTDFDPEIASQINVEDMDKLVAKGGIIKLDQLSPNDPRFFTAADRAKLSLHPDISIGGLAYVGEENWQDIFLGLGTTMAIGPSSLGVLQAAIDAKRNHELLSNTEKAVIQALNSISFHDLENVELAGSTGGVDFDLQELIAKKLCHEITQRTVKAGAIGTVAISGCLLALGMLFPPAFVVLASLAVAGVGVGGISTAIASRFNFKKCQKNLIELFAHESVLSALKSNKERLLEQMGAQTEGYTLITQTLANRKAAKHLTKAAQALMAGTLLVRMSAMGKYAMPVIGKVAWISASVIATISTAVAAALNVLQRKEKYEKIAESTINSIIPHIHRSKYGIIGKTPFIAYLKKNRLSICKALELPSSLKLKELVAELNLPLYAEIKQNYEYKCASEFIQNQLSKFAKTQKIAPEQMYEQEALIEFAIAQVGEFAHSDVMKAGIGGTIKMSAAAGAMSLVFTPVGGFIWIGAAGIVPLGLIVTKAVAMSERYKFRKKVRRLLNGNTDESLPLEEKHRQELVALLHMLSELKPN